METNNRHFDAKSVIKEIKLNKKKLIETEYSNIFNRVTGYMGINNRL